MLVYDTINAVLEIVQVITYVPTLHQAWKLKRIEGLHWAGPCFYCAWNWWNTIVWYPHLNQFWSWIGSFLIAIISTFWVWMVFHYTPRGQFSSPFKKSSS